MSSLETQPILPLAAAKVRARCPECNARLAILRVVAGKAGSEYWTMRCTKCGGIHLDVVSPSSSSLTSETPS